MYTSLLVESKYILMVSNRLDRFKAQGNGLYNFRCPKCGDSKTNKFKARGYLFPKEGTHLYKCHNCGISMSFRNLLKDIDTVMYDEFVMELFAEQNKGRRQEKVGYTPKPTKTPVRRHDKFGPLKELKKISQLDPFHPAKLYIEKRLIPAEHHHKIFYTPKFGAWCKKHFAERMSPRMLKRVAKDEGRILFPFIDEKGYVFGVQGRSLKKDGLRYITQMFTDQEKVFGLERVKFGKLYFIVEGPIDSLFLRNAIAMAGADIPDKYTTNKNAVFVYDNEPRNKDIVKRMERCIADGKKLVIWPEDIKEKDINDIILQGMSTDRLNELMAERIFSGLDASLEFNKWKRL